MPMQPQHTHANQISPTFSNSSVYFFELEAGRMVNITGANVINVFSANPSRISLANHIRNTIF
jgi:hypothetical protein